MFSWDLESALRSSLPTTACVSALAGVVSHHLVFRRYEFDSLGWQLVWAFLGSCLALCAAYSHVFGITDSIIRVVVVATAYNTAVTTSILIYRAFFHRLRRFPGPFAARLSAFYACRKSMDKVQGCVDVENLHKEYGDVVRIGTSA